MRFKSDGSVDTTGYTVDMDGKNSIETSNTYKDAIYAYKDTTSSNPTVLIKIYK